MISPLLVAEWVKQTAIAIAVVLVIVGMLKVTAECVVALTEER